MTVVNHLRSKAAVVGCCLYLLTFPVPISWDLALVSLAISVLVAAPGQEFRSTRARIAIIGGVAVFVTATIASVGLSRSWDRTLLGAAPMLPAMLLFITISYRFAIPDLRLLLLSFGGLALVVAASALLGWASESSSDPGLWIAKFSRIVSAPNDCVILAILSPILLVLYITERNAVIRASALGVLLLCATVIVLARSRLGILTLMIALVAPLVALRSRKLGWLLMPVLGIIVLIDSLFGFALVHKFADATGESRIALWWAAWHMFVASPAFGHGPNMFGILYPVYIAGFPVTTQLRVDMFYVPWPHNLYLEVLAERGVFALLGFLSAFVGAIAVAWRACRDPVMPYKTYGAAMLGALVGVGVSAFAELTFLHLWVPIVVFALFGITARLGGYTNECTTRNENCDC